MFRKPPRSPDAAVRQASQFYRGMVNGSALSLVGFLGGFYVWNILGFLALVGGAWLIFIGAATLADRRELCASLTAHVYPVGQVCRPIHGVLWLVIGLTAIVFGVMFVAGVGVQAR